MLSTPVEATWCWKTVILSLRVWEKSMWSLLALVYDSKEACGWLDIFGVGDLLDPVNIQTQPSLLQWFTTLAMCRLSQCFLYPYGLFPTITCYSLSFHAKPFTLAPTLWPKTKLCLPKIMINEALSYFIYLFILFVHVCVFPHCKTFELWWKNIY